MAKIEILSQGTIFSDEKSRFGYCGWPTICADRQGVLYVGYSGFRMRHICPFGKATIQKSTDGGKTWSVRIVASDTLLDDRDISLVNMPDGRLFMGWLVNDFKMQSKLACPYTDEERERLHGSNAVIAGMIEFCEDSYSEEEKRGGAYCKFSADGGMTWTETYSMPTYAPHGPCVLSDGSLLLLGKDYVRGTVTSHRSADGREWTQGGDVPFPAEIRDVNIWEPHVIQLPDGRLLGMVRVDPVPANPLPLDSFTLYQTYSDDLGKTWTTAEPTGVCGAPAHLMLASNGMLVCSFGRRKRPYGERILLSFDAGAHWEEHILFDDAPSSDLGYPSTAELPDGSFVTAYYQRTSENAPASVMYTKWKLA